MATTWRSTRTGVQERRTGPIVYQAIRVSAMVIANIAVFMVLFQLYKSVRKTFIQRAESVGYIHAEQIIDLEKRLHIFVEPHMQGWVLRHEELIRPFNRYYSWFMWLFYACCIVAMVLAPVRYRRLRRVFLLTMVIALPWYAIYPLAPPRFMPHYGFVDTLAVYGPQYFKDNGLVKGNHYAAMPSMHVGWTTVGAFMLAAAISYKRIGAMLGLLHVALMSTTVVVTGNHFVLDIIGGWLVVLAAFGVARMLPDEIRWPWQRKAKMRDRALDGRIDARYEKQRRSARPIREESAKTY